MTEIIFILSVPHSSTTRQCATYGQRLFIIPAMSNLKKRPLAQRKVALLSSITWYRGTWEKEEIDCQTSSGDPGKGHLGPFSYWILCWATDHPARCSALRCVWSRAFLSRAPYASQLTAVISLLGQRRNNFIYWILAAQTGGKTILQESRRSGEDRRSVWTRLPGLFYKAMFSFPDEKWKLLKDSMLSCLSRLESPFSQNNLFQLSKLIRLSAWVLHKWIYSWLFHLHTPWNFFPPI